MAAARAIVLSKSHEFFALDGFDHIGLVVEQIERFDGDFKARDFFIFLGLFAHLDERCDQIIENGGGARAVLDGVLFHRLVALAVGEPLLERIILFGCQQFRLVSHATLKRKDGA